LFNLSHNFVVLDELSAIQLSKPFLDFCLEPEIMLKIGLDDLLHKLFGAAPAFGRCTPELVFKLGIEVNIHGDSLATKPWESKRLKSV